MANRSTEKSEAAIKKLKDDTGKDAIFLKLDLASLEAVKAAAAEFNRSVSVSHCFSFDV
jgi:NAD(P)-dependent dehydrogenase (short-subunit alcohol dehydrogenase family)